MVSHHMPAREDCQIPCLAMQANQLLLPQMWDIALMVLWREAMWLTNLIKGFLKMQFELSQSDSRPWVFTGLASLHSPPGKYIIGRDVFSGKSAIPVSIAAALQYPFRVQHTTNSHAFDADPGDTQCPHQSLRFCSVASFYSYKYLAAPLNKWSHLERESCTSQP